MRYSIEPRDRIYVKGYGFLPFAKNSGKNLSSKYGQKLLDTAKKSTTKKKEAKTASKRAIQKIEEASGDLISNKIADKRTSVSKKSSLKHSEDEIKVGRSSPKYVSKASLKDVPKKRYISPEERQQIIDELKLV